MSANACATRGRLVAWATLPSMSEYTLGVASPAGVGSQRALRNRNRALVLGALSRFGPLSQTEIAARTTLSHATVFNIVSTLLADGSATAEVGRRNGRKAKVISLCQPAVANVALGLAVGRTAITGLACAPDGAPLLSVGVPRVAGARYEDELGVLAQLVGDVQKKAELAQRPIMGVGVSLATWVDFDSGRIPADCDWYGFPVISGWPGSSLRDDLEARLQVPVRVDSDGNAATLAEARWGAARGCSDVVYIQVQEGVTGGLFLNGRLYRGERGLAGSFGHSAADPSGLVCICGSRGCLETFFSPDRLLEPLRHLYGPSLTVPQVAALAATGDAGCTRIVIDTAERLGRALSNVVNVLVPQRIVIGGDLVPAGAILTEALDRTLRSLMPPIFHPGIVLASALPDAAAAGGAALVFDEE